MIGHNYFMLIGQIKSHSSDNKTILLEVNAEKFAIQIPDYLTDIIQDIELDTTIAVKGDLTAIDLERIMLIAKDIKFIGEEDFE